MKHRHSRPHQVGAALLTAMLTVTLVATFASAAMWQQWRGVEVESAERQRVQMTWVLSGALDWARLILQEDARSAQVDHLSEPWALPLQEARLSSFLAVDRNNTDDTMEAFLSGRISDEQALLNVSNLVEGGKRHAPSVKTFRRLFNVLNVPAAQLDTLVNGLIKAQAADTLLMPVRTSQLVWLGVPVQTLQLLAPYITLLPGRTAVNLNTAAPEVMVAVLPGLEMGQARRLVAQRASAHYPAVGDALRAAGLREDQVDASQLSVVSRFFAVRGRLRLGDMAVQERSLVERQGVAVKVLWRQRDVAGTGPSLQ